MRYELKRASREILGCAQYVDVWGLRTDGDTESRRALLDILEATEETSFTWVFSILGYLDSRHVLTLLNIFQENPYEFAYGMTSFFKILEWPFGSSEITFSCTLEKLRHVLIECNDRLDFAHEFLLAGWQVPMASKDVAEQTFKFSIGGRFNVPEVFKYAFIMFDDYDGMSIFSSEEALLRQLCTTVLDPLLLQYRE